MERNRRYFNWEGHEFYSCRIKLGAMRGFQPLRFALEADTDDVAAWDLLCDFLDLAAEETVRGRTLCPAFLENSIWLPEAGEVSLACICVDAGARAFASHSRD
jgi:hypothetical protein